MSFIRSVLDNELKEVETEILRLGNLVIGQLRQAMTALHTRDAKLAREIIAADAELNEIATSVEKHSVVTIARQQPLASDLRRIIADLYIGKELERMGDYAARVAKAAMLISDQDDGIALPKELADMAEINEKLLIGVLEAYLAHDPAAARFAASGDDQVDALYDQFVHNLMEQMAGNPNATNRHVRLLFAGHYLERIGDRITNIAEQVVYMESGRNVELNP